MDMRLEARDALQHVAHRLERRQRAAAIGVEQRDGAQLKGAHQRFARCLDRSGKSPTPLTLPLPASGERGATAPFFPSPRLRGEAG